MGKPLPVAGTELAYGAGSLWASQRGANHVARIDPANGETVALIAVGNGPTGIAFGGGAVWVANTLDGTVTRIDPETNAQAAVIPVGNGPTSVAADARGVWVSDQYGGTLVKIDPRTNRLVGRSMSAMARKGSRCGGPTSWLRYDTPGSATAAGF